MAVTVRDRDKIQETISTIYSKAAEIYTLDPTGHAWSLNRGMQTVCDQLIETAPAASTGFVNIVTCLIAKVVDPSIDCRYHREPSEGMPIPGKGSEAYLVGRPISEEIVAPWLQEQAFTAAKSGWQTRTYERPRPYMLDYSENIKPKMFKSAFLKIFDFVESQNQSAEEILLYLFVKEMIRRDTQQISIAVPSIDTVSSIYFYLQQHFFTKYKTSGAARLPVLALYAVYMILIEELRRFSGCKLLPLQEHSSADMSSGAIGDIEISDANNRRIEGVEVKHQIGVDSQMVRNAAEKFKEHQVKRYYILTTAEPCVDPDKQDECQNEIKRISINLGCQVIINGILPTIQYYLRLVHDPSEFFPHYAQLLKSDHAVKFEHRERWNKIIGG